MEEVRLDAELDGCAEGCRVDTDIGTDARGDVLARRRLDRLVHGMVDRVADEGQDECHVEAVGSESEDPPIAKEQRLQQQGDGDRYAGRFRPQQECNERTSDRVTRCASGQRDIEHHAEEGEGREDAEQGHLFFRDGLLDLFDCLVPDGHHGCRHDRTGLRAQIVFRNMHTVLPFYIHSVTIHHRLVAGVSQAPRGDTILAGSPFQLTRIPLKRYNYK